MTDLTLTQLLADPSIKAASAASLNGAADAVEQMGDIQARYVGVQLAGVVILSLAAVQVLGISNATVISVDTQCMAKGLL